MKIVKFKDGKYAVRKGWIWYKYASLRQGGKWYRISESIEECKGSYDDILYIYNYMINHSKDKGTPI